MSISEIILVLAGLALAADKIELSIDVSKTNKVNHNSLGRLATKLFRLLAMLQSNLLELTRVGVYKSNLLNLRVIMATDNHHIRLLSRALAWLHPIYSGVAADIVMESI